ncbi:MAG: hypothetical protein ACP5IE_06160, partial [Infirmifilum sp.]
ILLLLGSVESLKSIIRERISEVILLAMLVLALISGIYTVKNASDLYIHKIPYLTLKPPTQEEIIFITIL